MKMIVCKSVMLTFGVGLMLSVVRAEDIQLKDGSKISGRITSVNDNAFEVKTAYGVIKVPRTDIVAIQFPQNAPAKNEQGSGTSDSALPAIQESLDGTSYVNRTAHFQVQVPKGWVLAPQLRKGKEIVASLMSTDALFFLVTAEGFTGSLSTYRVLVETQAQSKFRDYQKISETDAKVDGKPALRLVLQAKSPDNGVVLKFLIYILADGDQMVRLTFFTLEPLFDDAVATFESIVSSYHLTADKSIATLIPSNQ
jgi:RNase P/RNase MRP subunit p29